MKNNASLLYSFALIFIDALALIAAFVSAYILRVTYGNTPIANPVSARSYLLIVVSLLPVWLVLFALIGLYNRSIYEKRFSELGRLFMGTLIGSLLIIGFDYFSNDVIFPAKLVPVYGMALTFAYLFLFRSVARIVRRTLFSHNFGISNVLLVGNTSTTSELVHWLADPKVSGYRVVGVVGSNEHFSKVKSYKTFAEATKRFKTGSIHSIMQTELFPDSSANNEILTFAQNNHVSYRFIPGNSELFVGKIDVELFQSSIPMIAVHQTPLIGWGRIVKRIFDQIVGTLALILLSPLMLILAVLVKLTDPKGPVFMRGVQQERLTRFNTVFKIYKFRSHYAKFDGKSYEEVFKMVGKPELIDEYKKNGFQMKNDFRVTPLGRFMRKTSLDELPQLINVVKGDLSLVGPRALIPYELNQYEKRHTILSVKSGVTGLAAISGRREIPFEERRKLDLYYVQNWSFWFDIVILLKTVRFVFSRKKDSEVA